MKKVLLIALGVLLLIGLVLFFFLGDGKQTISNFFNEEADFGSFFDVEPQSQNDFVSIPDDAEIPAPSQTGYVAPVLRQISLEPVAGFTHYATSTLSTRTSTNPEQGEIVEEFMADSTVIRFQERGTGHVYDVFEFLESPQKVSNITVQKVYNAIFTNDPNEFLYQAPTFDHEQIVTTHARIIPAKPETETEPATEQMLERYGISSSIPDLTYLSSSNQLLYSIKTPAGSQIYISDTRKSNEKLIATLPFKEFTLQPLNNTQALLQTKASALQPGYAYTLNLSTGNLTKIVGSLAGLLVKPTSDLSHYLYSQSDTSRPIIRSYTLATRENRRIGLDTIPEKCVLSSANDLQLYCFGSVIYQTAVYPDDWYKGKVFNREGLYLIDLPTGEIMPMYTFGNNEPLFDVINPQITSGDGHIIFQNKYDLTLWAIHLEGLRNQF